MRLLLIANLLFLSVGIGNSFQVTEFLGPFLRNGNTNQPARQSEEGNELEDQIGPIFIVTLAAATIWNLITMGKTSTEISSNGVNHEFTWTITGEPFAHCIAPGDTMKFNWSGTFHNVQSVDKDGYDNCSGFSNTQGVQSPYIFNGTTAGTYYFVCGVGTHCSSGQQKAIITVSSNC